jgi:hypothetical protein
MKHSNVSAVFGPIPYQKFKSFLSLKPARQGGIVKKSVPDPDHFGGPGSGFAIIDTNPDPSIDEQKD